MKSKSFLIILLFASIVGQSQDVTLKTFEFKPVGWTIKYPADWPEVSKEEIAQIEGRGLKAMEATVESEIEMSHTNLLWIKKNIFNSFTSNAQPFNEQKDGPHSENYKLIQDAILQAFTSQGIKHSVKYETFKIDGLDFNMMEVTIYHPKSPDVALLNQIILNRFIGKKSSLTLNINYNNAEDKAALIKMLESSKFSIRN